MNEEAACACEVTAPGEPLGPSAWRRKLLLLVVALVAWALVYRFLQPATAWLAHAAFAGWTSARFTESAAFFLYDVPKVLLLLTLIVYAVGVVRTFFTPERTRALLAGRRESVGNVLAAALGIVTPFCSCSAVPLFIGFVTAGVPLGVTLSFLISAPLVNEVALVLLFGLFGWRVAALYLGAGLLIAIVAGWVMGRLHMERWVEDWVCETPSGAETAEVRLTWNDRLNLGEEAVRDIVGRVWLYVLLGIAVGAGIHGSVPQDFLASIMGKSAWWAVPVAVVLGVPLYSNAAGIIPIVQALLEKGAALGTVLAFMMSVIALSLPEAIILRRVLKPRLILAFFGVVALGILLVGYLFNAIM